MNIGSPIGIWHETFRGKEIIVNALAHTISLVNTHGLKITTEYPCIPTMKDLKYFKIDMIEMGAVKDIKDTIPSSQAS